MSSNLFTEGLDYSNFFRLANLTCGVLMILGGIGQLFPHRGIQNIIISVYVILFGSGTILVEYQLPPYIPRYASFMLSFFGRGLFYMFVGTIIVGNYWWMYIAGTLVGLLGLAYIGLEFIPSIEPPVNMRDPDTEWTSDQV